MGAVQCDPSYHLVSVPTLLHATETQN